MTKNTIARYLVCAGLSLLCVAGWSRTSKEVAKEIQQLNKQVESLKKEQSKLKKQPKVVYAKEPIRAGNITKRLGTVEINRRFECAYAKGVYHENRWTKNGGWRDEVCSKCSGKYYEWRDYQGKIDSSKKAVARLEAIDEELDQLKDKLTELRKEKSELAREEREAAAEAKKSKRNPSEKPAVKDDESAARPNGLIHRWSFNGDLKDSVGNRDGKSLSGEIPFENGQARIIPGGGYVDLGADVIPGGKEAEYTIEVWATKYSVRHWARVFHIFDNWGNNDYYWAWNCGTDPGSWLWKTAGINHMVQRDGGGLLDNVEHHFVIVYGHDKDNSSKPYVSAYLSRDGKVIWSRTENLVGSMFESHFTFFLGQSYKPQDSIADASYNEVRIWNRALTDDEIKRTSQLGPDKLP